MKAVVQKDADGMWAVDLVAKNGQNVWRTHRRYQRRRDADKAVETLVDSILDGEFEAAVL